MLIKNKRKIITYCLIYYSILVSNISHKKEEFEKIGNSVVSNVTIKETTTNLEKESEETKEKPLILSIHSEEMKKLGDYNQTSLDKYQNLKSFIIQISNKYNIPYDILETIIHQESGGCWNTNGVISPTSDYGLTQINECNLEKIYNDLGYTKEEILYEAPKAIDAQAHLIKEIIDLYGYEYDTINYKEVFGTYNGWIKWKNKEISREYADSCMKILNEGVEKILTK